MFLKVNWIGVGFGILSVGARVFTRIKILKHLSLDDYLMIVSLTFGIVTTATNTAAVNAGFGKHIEALRPDQILRAVKYQYIIQPFAYLALVFGRVSFAVSLIVLIGINKWRRWLLKALIIGQFVLNLIWVGLWLGQCSPPNKYWNRQLPGKCMDPRIEIDAGYVSSSFNIFTDLVLAMMPSVVLSNLNMRLRTKVGLIFLLSLGIFNMVAAIITIIEISKIGGSRDFTYEYILVDVWGIIQLYLAIVLASVPFIRPLFRNVKLSHLFSWTFYNSILRRYTRRSHSGDSNEESLTLAFSEPSHSHLPCVRRDRFVTTTLKAMVVEDEADSIQKTEQLDSSDAVLEARTREQGPQKNGERV